MAYFAPGKVPKHEKERQRAERKAIKAAKRDARRDARTAEERHVSMIDPTEGLPIGR